MQINFTKKFMKTLRLSLGLNEFEMAEHLRISVHEYVDFEDLPMKFGGELVYKYVEFLEVIPETENLSHMFLEFMKFDLQTASGVVNIFDRFPLTLVQDESESSII